MNRSRVSLAALSALCLASTPPRTALRTAFADTLDAAADPLSINFTLKIDDDAGPGAAITEDKKPDGTISDEQRAQQQAENAGGTQQANADDTTDTGGAKTTAVGDPPAGTDQQQ